MSASSLTSHWRSGRCTNWAMGCGLQLSMGCGEMFRSLHGQQGEEALSRKSHHVWHTPVVHQNPCGAQPHQAISTSMLEATQRCHNMW